MELLMELLSKWGFLGLFLLAFASNAIPYSTIPYLVFIAPLLPCFTGFELLYAILSLAVGATLGKLIVYFIGRSFGRIKRISNYTWSTTRFFTKHQKPVFILVLLVAALPIPDDVFYIPIGTLGYSIVKYTIALFIGKLIVTILTYIYGASTAFLLEGIVGIPVYLSIPISIIVTIILYWIIGKIDWNNVENVFIEKGSLTAFIYILNSLMYIVSELASKFIMLFKKIIARR
jgi:membrane protein YqaA with SNARE-associated domain